MSMKISQPSSPTLGRIGVRDHGPLLAKQRKGGGERDQASTSKEEVRGRIRGKLGRTKLYRSSSSSIHI